MSDADYKTAVQDKAGKGAKLAYGIGAVAENTMQNGINTVANPFFNVALGVSPSLLGIATFVFRIWDAVTDPIMGMISDRTESRFGASPKSCPQFAAAERWS